MRARSASPEPSPTDSGRDGGTTEGRAFERLLRSDPELLRSLVDQAADAVCLHEIDGAILDVNLRMCRTLGYTREELLQLSVLDIDVTATRDGTARVARSLQPGVPLTAERVLRRKDGSTFPIELSLSLIVSGSRQLLLGIARDITDRKGIERARADTQRLLEERVRERTQHLEVANRRLEEEILARQRTESALRASEAQFRELAERGHMLAWEADATSWQFVYVGPQAVELLGYPIGDWYRPGFWVEHLHPDDRERVLEQRRTQSQRETDYELEYRMLGADGRTVWLQVVVHVIRDDGGPRRLRGFMIDITARRRAEEARQLLLRELDHRVKNTLSTVQAVVELTLRSSSSLEAFGEMLRGRIAALRPHALRHLAESRRAHWSAPARGALARALRTREGAHGDPRPRRLGPARHRRRARPGAP
jgi:PAS domain S-box-containing protein